MYSNNNTALGEILVEDGIISKNQLNMALRIRKPAEISGRELVKLRAISPFELYIALEALLADILVDLGYADEREIFDMYSVITGADAYPESANAS